MTTYATGAPFQIVWSDGNTSVLMQAPVAGGNVLVSKQPPGPNNGGNVWLQKHENGRIYLVDSAGQPTRYCLDATLPGGNPAGPAFPTANGCLVYLNVDTPQRQTQLWTIIEQADGKGYNLQNVGLSISLPEGPGSGLYQLDSAGSAGKGSACQLWQQSTGYGPNQVWQLQVVEA